MSQRDDTQAQLQEYLQALPADRRVDRGLARDRDARRQRLLPQLRAHATRERHRVQRRRALVRAAGLIALGGAAATALGLSLPHVTTVRTTATPSATVASASVPISEAIVFEAPADHPARVRVGDAVTMTLAPGTRARPLAPAGAPLSLAVALERGRAHFEVQKLYGGRRFHVRTLDADVEVRGTVFDVAVSSLAGAPTCVSVDEGLVQVAKAMSTRLLARGESWDCGAASDSVSAVPAARTAGTAQPEAATSAAPAKEAAAAAPASASVRRRREIPPIADADTKKTETEPPPQLAGTERAAASVATSDLRVQNQIFQAALSAQRAGRTGEAIGLYQQLIARAPNGPLAGQAGTNLAAITARAAEKEEGAR